LPLYPYRCTQCGYRFEKIQSFHSEPESKCPKCGGALERPLTAPGLQFKGAGWYVTDYSSRNSTAADSPAAESKPASAEKPAATGAAPAAAAAKSDAKS